MNKLPEKELLRPDEVARYFSVDRHTVYRWVKEGKLRADRVGKQIRIIHDSVLALRRPV